MITEGSLLVAAALDVKFRPETLENQHESSEAAWFDQMSQILVRSAFSAASNQLLC